MNATDFKPLKDRVLVRKLPSEEKTTSGIIIPESGKEKPMKGIVMAIGPEVKEVQLADMIYYGRYGGTELKIDGQDHLVMREEEILAVVE